jgi:four helix bundle protein
MNELEQRCIEFSVKIRKMIYQLPKNISNIEDGKQVVRSSGSIGANYIEANESLGNKDKVFRLKIARKEAKETIYWLMILQNTNLTKTDDIEDLIGEAGELRKIFSSIIIKLTDKFK